MGRLALVAGHSFLGAEAALPFAGEARAVEVSTRNGTVRALDGGNLVLLQRHGFDAHRPAHLIDHQANLMALRELGCDRVLAVASVGSLRVELGVGAIVCPDDFIAPQLGISVFDDLRGHLVPGFDREWRRRVLAAWPGGGAPREGGVYWQSIGPRFETPAEVRMIAAHADVVGMTVASECVVAGELGIAYAALCAVDNLANGLGDAPLGHAELAAAREANRASLASALEAVAATLAGEAA